MKQKTIDKIKNKIHQILRVIAGKKYSCCDGYKRCSKCRYVKGSEE